MERDKPHYIEWGYMVASLQNVCSPFNKKGGDKNVARDNGDI